MKLKELYKKEIQPKLMKDLGYKNALATPRVDKVVLNVGLGKNFADKAQLEHVEETLARISGQKPVHAAARKSISNFKIREGNIIGMKVTLRGKKMYDFLEKLIHISLPRVKDFRGLKSKSVDRTGNLSIGFKENIAFPEIKADEIEKIHGLEICISSTATSKKEGLALFRAMGFPFKSKTTK